MNADSTPSSAASSPPESLIVGQVVAPFGVKGELKVNILTEFPDRFSRLKEIILAPFGSIEPGLAPTAALDPKTVASHRATGASGPVRSTTAPRVPTPYGIEASQVHKGQLILKLKAVDSAEDAEMLRGCWLLVPLEKARRLPDDAFYIYQVVNLDVVTESGVYIGKVRDIITTSANDVYIVKGPGVTDPTGELLVPAIKSVVKSVEPEAGRVVIADPQEWL